MYQNIIISEWPDICTRNKCHLFRKKYRPRCLYFSIGIDDVVVAPMCTGVIAEYVGEVLVE